MGVLYLASLGLIGLVAAQHPAANKPEVHPKLTTWKCTKSGGCVSQNTAIVIDSLSRPVYQINNPSQNCGSWGSGPNPTACPDAATCQKNCVMEGIDDYSRYGIKTTGGSLSLDMLRDSDLKELSPRVYLLSETENSYEMLRLTGQEFSFDADVSKLPCGMNGALYLSEMREDGGKSTLNTGGPAYGTGYCDAQCFVTPFINGEGNIKSQGSCCNELDIWEANSQSTHIAPHTCSKPGLYKCTGSECGSSGVCDKGGCAYNPYGVGNQQFYGRKMTVDTSRPFTVVTQFPTDSSGALNEIRRLYIQDGKIIQNAVVKGSEPLNYLNDDYCKTAGGTQYLALGGTKGMGAAMSRGMVLAMSIWWDGGSNMNWLDSGNAGRCSSSEGNPSNVIKVQPDTAVTFSNIKWGEIDSTYKPSSSIRRAVRTHY